MLVAAVIIIVSVVETPGSIAKKDFIKIGEDEIPSVKFITGEERNVTGVSTSNENGVIKKVITYSGTGRNREEMLRYAQALYDYYGFWFYETDENDFADAEGVDLKLAKASVEADFIIIVRIDYDRNGYTITLSRYRGSLTVID